MTHVHEGVSGLKMYIRLRKNKNIQSQLGRGASEGAHGDMVQALGCGC